MSSKELVSGYRSKLKGGWVYVGVWMRYEKKKEGGWVGGWLVGWVVGKGEVE